MAEWGLPLRLVDAQLLLELGRDITSTLDLQEVVDKSFAALRRMVTFGGGAIQLVEDGVLVPAVTDPPAPAEHMSVRIPIGEGVSGVIAATGRPRYIPNVPELMQRRPGIFKAVSPGVVSYFGWPLILQGQPIGVVQIDAPQVDAFPPEVQTLVLAFAPAIAAAVQNALLFERQREVMEKLQTADQLKKEFVSIVSHELRTPLTTILGFASTLSDGADRLSPAVLRESAERIFESGKNLQLLINDLLDLSELQRRVSQIELGPVELHHVVNKAIFEVGERTHPIKVEIPEDLPPALADDGRVFQIVQQLISNAKRFSDDGASIEVAARSEGDEIVLTVADRGRGIPSDMLPNVFDPFFQVEDAQTRAIGGLGIGLYLVREICDAMGASVDAKSEVGESSTFTVRFPICA
ncbi:MAG: ATP-binding protein [Actinomycetota bacterium]